MLSPMVDQDVFDISPSGDLLLQIKDNGTGLDNAYRVSTTALRKASSYFHVLLDASKFSEGIAVDAKVKELQRRYEGKRVIPSFELPTVSISDVGQLPRGASSEEAVRLFLKVLHNSHSSWPAPRTHLVALLAIIADRFAATATIADYIIRQDWKKGLVSQLDNTSAPRKEGLLRQKLLIGLLLRFPDWVRQYSASLIVGGSERWLREGKEVKDKALWWSLPDGVEEELLCRREYILETISSLQTHFIALYASRQPQCKLGYDSSPQCDSFQLGEMIRFFTRKGLLNLQATFFTSLGTHPTYPGSMTDLLLTLKECPTYQIDRNHTHCGLRSRFYPALESIRPLSQAGICLHCWKGGRDGWVESPAGGSWRLGMPRLERPTESCRDHRSFWAMYTAEKRDWTPAVQQEEMMGSGPFKKV